MANIRIRNKDIAEYNRLVKNTKAKISRTQKNYGVELDINIPSLDSFTTREEFNTFKSKQARFTNRSTLDYQYVKSDFGVVATKKELMMAERYTRQAQRQARKIQKEYGELPFYVGGEQAGTVGQAMTKVARPNVAGVYVPEDFDFKSIKDRDYFDKKLNKMKERSDPQYFDQRLVTFKDNYITSIEEHFNSIADNLVREIQSLPDDTFFEVYLMNLEMMDFNEHYTTPEGEMREYILNLESIIKSAKAGNYDLKDF